MKTCPVCHTENEDDALYCKRCGEAFFEDDKKSEDKKKQKVKKQKKVKTKTKYNTKIKKEKVPGDKQKSNFFSKVLVFILLIIVIALAGVLGVFAYHYYQENNIPVPNVIGYSYEEAVTILNDAKLSYQQKTELTTDEEEVGNVIKQSKHAGSKTRENAVITLTVGVLDTRVKVPDVRGLTLEKATDTLNQVGISYQVVYEESSKDANLVLKQSIRSGKVIDNTESITLTVSVPKKQNESSSSTDNNSEEDINTDDETISQESSDVLN